MEWSQEVQELLSQLSWQQRAGVERLAIGRAEGISLRSMLQGPDKVCGWTTYWRRSGKRVGWAYQETFQRALDLMCEEYKTARLERAVDEAAEELRRAAPEAARLARRAVQFALGEGLGASVVGEDRTTMGALELLLLEARGDSTERVRAATALVTKGLAGGLSVLDRVGVETAARSGETALLAQYLASLQGCDTEEEEDNGEVADVGAESEGV